MSDKSPKMMETCWCLTCLADVDLSVVHEVEDGGEVGEADAVQEDHGLRVRVLLQHLPSGSFIDCYTWNFWFTF